MGPDQLLRWLGVLLRFAPALARTKCYNAEWLSTALW